MSALSDTKEVRRQSSYAGSMICAAYGDTLGMAVEMWKKEQITKYIGKITEPIDAVIVRDGQGNIVEKDEFGRVKSYHSRRGSKGTITDDTILALALAQSLTKSGYDLDAVAQQQLIAFDTYGKHEFGFTTKESMARLQSGISPHLTGVYGFPGNGPAMKMHPLGIYMHATESYANGLQFAKAVGRITHLDPRSVASGVVQAHATHEALQNGGREAWIRSLVDIAREFELPLPKECEKQDAGQFLPRLEWIAAHANAEDDDAHAALGSGSDVYSSHPFALFMVQKHWDDPLDGLLALVNYGGDCDTTGAMAGAIWGARHGIFVPKDWPLERKDELYAVAQEMADRA